MTKLTNEALTLAANTIRCLAMDGVQAARSGHPGAPMGLADIAAVLWLKYLKHDPADSQWADRDRFVLSGGHGSMLLYSLLHLAGYALPLDELKRFRQLGSLTPGHPEYRHTDGVETTTGPLGQGIATAIGMAIAERMSAARFNVADAEAVVDHRTWIFCGDGDLEEGISHEACSLAGHLKLDRVVLFYDSNGITIEGSTDLALSDDAKKRFQAYQWHVLETDGHDLDAIDRTIRKAMRLTGKPVMILCKTHIGKGSPNKQDSHEAHGAPLGEEEVRLTKRALGFPEDQSFYVPQEVYAMFQARAVRMKRVHGKWTRSFKAWAKAHPELAERWAAAREDRLPADIEERLPKFDPAKAVATRSASGAVLNALAPLLPQLVGGSADLAPSNMTWLKEMGEIRPGDFAGRNFHFGIRELAMAAILNGVQIHGGFRIFGGTFFVFSDYCRPAMRLAALMGLPVIYVYTHDSFYVGEDGPTHEPVEQLAALRCMPNVTVIRPADPTETAAAWVAALKNRKGPTALLLTRQNMRVIDRSRYPAASNLEKGAYTLWQNGEGTPDLILIATGSEVELALDAAQQIPDRNVRVVSMPSWELFEKQNRTYRERILDPDCKRRLVVEAGSAFGWERYAGTQGARVTLDTFGASGAYKDLARHFGFTVENVLAVARELLAR
ncbi:MAG: transketolase [Kiritimatiellia bacterium]|jgi:transketolase|nr:transketolase [Kiritimatiellia bacterium]